METARLMQGRQQESSTRSTKHQLRCVWLLVSVLFLLTSLATSQLYTGSIAGTVTDPSGAVIPSASVNATDQNKGFAFTATTDSAGRYLLRPIPPGKYNISVEAPNFQSERKQEVTVEVNQSVTVDFSMKVGAANQVVDVEAGASELQTQDAVTGQVVDRRLINNLPLINRDFLSLSYLAPGVTEVDTQCQGCPRPTILSPMASLTLRIYFGYARGKVGEAAEITVDRRREVRLLSTTWAGHCILCLQFTRAGLNVHHLIRGADLHGKKVVSALKSSTVFPVCARSGDLGASTRRCCTCREEWGVRRYLPAESVVAVKAKPLF